jgi:hypothetical protein
MRPAPDLNRPTGLSLIATSKTARPGRASGRLLVVQKGKPFVFLIKRSFEKVSLSGPFLIQHRAGLCKMARPSALQFTIDIVAGAGGLIPEIYDPLPDAREGD